MRTTDLIRQILDLIDKIECQPSEEDIVDIEVIKPTAILPFSNTPDELYADVKKVTVDAGGGINGPKHPADIRANSVAMYPNLSYGSKE